MFKFLIVLALCLSSPLSYAQMGIFQSSPEQTPPTQQTSPAPEQKTQQMMQQQTTDQVKQQVEQYNAQHPVPTEGFTAPTTSQPAKAPAPSSSAPLVATPAPPLATSPNKYSTTQEQNNTKTQGYTGFQAPPNQNENQPAKNSGGWNIKY